MIDPCSKCGSNKIIPAAQIFDQGQASDGILKARVDTKPEKMIFKGSVLSKLSARICGVCGFTEVFASEPGALYEAYLKAEQRP